MQEVLAENRKVIGGDGRQLIYVPMPADAGKTASAPQLTPEMAVPALPAATDSIRNADRSGSRSANREEAGR